MNRKKIYRLINEEISEFDFLGMDHNSKEEAHDEVLSSKDFQTNLVIDIVNNPNDNNKFKKISTTFVNKDVDSFNDLERVEVEIDITYSYKEKDYDLIFLLDGEKDGEDIKFSDYNLKLFSKAGDKIDFEWIKKNEKLYNTFVESLVSPYLD